MLFSVTSLFPGTYHSSPVLHILCGQDQRRFEGHGRKQTKCHRDLLEEEDIAKSENFQEFEDAIGKDGEINIRTYPSSGDSEIVVAISDNGPGISEEMQKKIFDPFFTTKKVGEGTGLGLSISFGLIEKLGGRITLQSTEGQGTAFEVFLPNR